jgi:hypothetical protein
MIDVTPPDLESVGSAIVAYGFEHSLTPAQVVEIFHAGLSTGITVQPSSAA